MLKYIAFAATLFISSSSVIAACPQLSPQGIAYYSCPALGVYNPFPQGSSAMVYQRQKTKTFKEFCVRARATVAKLFGPENKRYSGIETEKRAGAIFCSYEVPATWKHKTGVSEGVIELKGTVKDSPYALASSCPSMDFSNFKGALQGDQVTVLGIQWSMATKGARDTAKKFLRGFTTTGKLSGTINGSINKAKSTPFVHTCSYVYKGVYETLTNLVLTGKMSLIELF